VYVQTSSVVKVFMDAGMWLIQANEIEMHSVKRKTVEISVDLKDKFVVALKVLLLALHLILYTCTLTCSSAQLHRGIPRYESQLSGEGIF